MANSTAFWGRYVVEMYCHRADKIGNDSRTRLSVYRVSLPNRAVGAVVGAKSQVAEDPARRAAEPVPLPMTGRLKTKLKHKSDISL